MSSDAVVPPAVPLAGSLAVADPVDGAVSMIGAATETFPPDEFDELEELDELDDCLFVEPFDLDLDLEEALVCVLFGGVPPVETTHPAAKIPTISARSTDLVIGFSSAAHGRRWVASSIVAELLLVRSRIGRVVGCVQVHKVAYSLAFWRGDLQANSTRHAFVLPNSCFPCLPAILKRNPWISTTCTEPTTTWAAYARQPKTFPRRSLSSQTRKSAPNPLSMRLSAQQHRKIDPRRCQLAGPDLPTNGPRSTTKPFLQSRHTHPPVIRAR